jgi:hypothetical protein
VRTVRFEAEDRDVPRGEMFGRRRSPEAHLVEQVVKRAVPGSGSVVRGVAGDQDALGDQCVQLLTNALRPVAVHPRHDLVERLRLGQAGEPELDEVGGCLAGHLRRDEVGPELEACVAQLDDLHARGQTEPRPG